MLTALRKGTMKNYYSTERCIKEFLKKEKGVEDIPFKKLDYGFIVDFEQYIRTYRPATRMGCANTGTMKHRELLKKMSRLAVQLEWLEKDPLSILNYDLKKQNVSF